MKNNKKLSKQVVVSNNNGTFDSFKEYFALDSINFKDIIFLYKVMISERGAYKNYFNYNPRMNVEKLHTKTHNILSDMYVNLYKSKFQTDSAFSKNFIRTKISNIFRNVAVSSNRGFFIDFSHYMLNRIKDRIDEVNKIKDIAKHKKAIDELKFQFSLLTKGRESMRFCLAENENELQYSIKFFDDAIKKNNESFMIVPRIMLNRAINYSGQSIILEKRINSILQLINKEKQHSDVKFYKNGFENIVIQAIQKVNNTNDTEATELYKKQIDKFYAGMQQWLSKKIIDNELQGKLEQIKIKKENILQSNDKQNDIVNNSKISQKASSSLFITDMMQNNLNENKGKNIWHGILGKRNKNNNIKSSYGMNLQKREETNKIIQKATDCKDFDLNKIYDNSLNKSKKVAKNNNARKLSQIRLYYNIDTNQHRLERMARRDINREGLFLNLNVGKNKLNKNF